MQEFILCIDNAKVHLKAVYKCNTKDFYMNLGPQIILKLYLIFSNFKSPYSYKLYSYKKECIL